MDKKAKSSTSPKKAISLKSDALFKSVMANTIAAREFLEEYLPEEVKALIDLSAIKVEKESYVEENLQRQLSDIVYSVKTKNDEQAFIYTLIEHQSSSDYLIAFRLFKYTMLLLERHIKDKARLPLIVPLVIYQGRRKYSAPRNLWQLFTHPELAKKLFTDDYRLIDLHSMPDDEIIRKKHIALFEYVLKHIHERDMLGLLENLFKLLPHAIEIDKKQDYFYIKKILWYIDTKVPAEKQEELNNLLINNLSKEEGEEIMSSIAQKYFDEGIDQGVKMGIEQGVKMGIDQGVKVGIDQGVKMGIDQALENTALKMLQQKIDDSLVLKVTGLSQEQLARLKRKI